MMITTARMCVQPRPAMIVVKVNWSAGNIKINGNDGQPRQNFCIITLGPPEVTNKYSSTLFCIILSRVIGNDIIML